MSEQEEGIKRAKEVVYVDRATCKHLLAGPKTHRCVQCRGILRRCCHTTLSWEHAEDCERT